MSGWRAALRIAWREALRAKGRTALMLFMIALPVLGVTAAIVVGRTADVRGVERADRVMGAADAWIFSDARGRVAQFPDPEDYKFAPVGEVDAQNPLTDSDLKTILVEGAQLTSMQHGWVRVPVGKSAIHAAATEVDLRNPMTKGLFDLTDGRWPEKAGEVVVNDALADRGLAIGDEVEINGEDVTVVGTGRDATQRADAAVLGAPGSFLAQQDLTRKGWLATSGGAGGIDWPTVQELNALGAVVTSREVIADPPEVTNQIEGMGFDTGANEMAAIIGLIVTMILLEVVLLAGPAFAVSARRQSRTLALIAASGGTPPQARAVILATGVVIGSLAAVVGSILGVFAGLAILPLAQNYSGQWFGPVDIPVLWMLPVAAFALVAALLAAVVPAYLASRQDVVAVLSGRRGDGRPSVRTPILGLILLGVGVSAASVGAVASDNGNGSYWIAFAAVISVLGMIMCVPVVVSWVARLAGRLPLSMKYAARDAARHRTRTVPAVAAVAATVAGVVALGIANASDERENQMTYTPQFAMGSGQVTWYPDGTAGVDSPATWQRLEAMAKAALPDAEVISITGVPEAMEPDQPYVITEWSEPGDRRYENPLLTNWGGSLGTSVVVSTTVPSVVSVSDPRGADSALKAGKAVVFTDRDVESDTVTMRTAAYANGVDGSGPSSRTKRDLPAYFVRVAPGGTQPAAILPPKLAEDLDLTVQTVGVVLVGDISKADQQRLDEQVAGAVPNAGVYIERGYQKPASAWILLAVLGALGGVLMLGGTLTATFLALSDARADMATLAAVGAAPRTRRRVAAAYALVIGFVGALLGAAVGFIPGIAISRPLTSVNYGMGEAQGPFLAIPWLLIVILVIGLPLLTAAIVGVSTRGRLPLLARAE